MFSGSNGGQKNVAVRQSHQQHKDYDFSKMMPIRNAAEILQDSCYQNQLSELKSLVMLEGGDAFEELFLSLINSYAEFVQMLPDSREGNRPLLHVALSRCMAAMKKTKVIAMTPRIQYAVFSASLLLQLGMVHVDYKVMLSDAEGIFLMEWSPFYQTMIDLQAPFYKVRPIAGNPARLLSTITPILAQKLLPLSGFEWIAEDPILLMQWVNALSRQDETGILGQVLDSAEDLMAQILQEFDAVALQQESAAATQIGEDYWHWLQEQVASGALVINGQDSDLIMTEEGLLVNHESLAKHFLKSYPNSSTSIVVCSQFNMLGLAPLSGEDYLFKQRFSVANQKTAATNRTFVGLATSMFGQPSGKDSPIGKRANAGAVAQSQTAVKSLSGQLMSHKGLLTRAGKVAVVASGLQQTGNISARQGLVNRLAARFSGQRPTSQLSQGNKG